MIMQTRPVSSEASQQPLKQGIPEGMRGLRISLSESIKGKGPSGPRTSECSDSEGLISMAHLMSSKSFQVARCRRLHVPH